MGIEAFLIIASAVWIVRHSLGVIILFSAITVLAVIYLARILTELTIGVIH